MGYTIKEAAKLLNLTPATLRYYDKEGLFPNLNRKGNIRQYQTSALHS